MTFLAAETLLTDMGEKLTLIAALTFFLYYFMKELKALRVQHDATRKEYEEKNERMTERMIKVEENTRAALEKNNQSNDRLAETIKELSQKINSINSPQNSPVI
jgi:flagellar biosynthesis/type III secretory pathway chaperone